MNTPPKNAIAFLRWFCREDYIEEVEGDLMEIYLIRKRQYPRLAPILFWFTVLCYFRPAFLKSVRNRNFHSIDLYKSYFRIGWRNIRNSGLYSLINIIGLATGILCSVAIGLFIADEFSYDRFHSDLDQLYRVVEKQQQAGVLYDVACTPGPLGKAMEKDYDEVLESCRFGRTMGTIRIEDKIAEPANIRYTDNSVFSMFNFSLLKGNKATVLMQPDEIILTPIVAEQLYGKDWENQPSLLGSTIVLTSWGKESNLKLTGIAAAPPDNSHIEFSVLISMATMENSGDFSWDNNAYSTYLKLRKDADINLFNKQLQTYIDRYSAYGSKDNARTLALQPMKDIYLHSDFDFGTNDAKSGSLVYIKIFIAVGAIVLLIAIFNFINLSTARVLHRTKEVGVRKVIGAHRIQLIIQFLTEGFLLTGLAVLLAVLLLQPLLPLIGKLVDKSMVLPFNQPWFYGALLGFVVIISLLAGIYPAFYLSRGHASRAFNSAVVNPKGNLFRKTLVISQFAFSVMLIIGSVLIYQQLNFIQQKNLGFDSSQVVYLQLKNELRNKAELFKQQLQNSPGIELVAQSSTSFIDATSSTTSIDWEGKPANEEMLITQANADHEMLEVMSMKLLAGTGFNNAPADSGKYLINETAASRMGWTPEEAIGKTIALWNSPGTVAGVVQDFHFQPLTMKIEPFIFRSWPQQPYNGLLIKTKAGESALAIAQMETIYKQLDAESVFSYQFLDDQLRGQYKLHYNTGLIVGAFTLLALLVSCLGLLGLSTYAAEQRRKEIGIRKVLGASVTAIVKLLSSDFIKLVVIAIIIAIPIAYWAMHQWMMEFAYKIEISWWVFLFAAVVSVLFAIITVAYHAIRTAFINPVTSIKSL